MVFSTRTATNVGLLVGVSIVLTRVFAVMVPIGGLMTLRLGFGEIPIMLAGILFGPIAGGLGGAIADLIGFALNSQGGAFFPGFTVSAALTGIIPGVLLYKKENISLTQLALVVFVTDLVTGVVLNTLWLTLLMERGFFVILPPRLVARLVTLPVYTSTIHLTRRAYAGYRRVRGSII